MTLPRRAFLAGCAAALAAPRVTAASSGERVLGLVHGGSRIGTQTIAVTRTSGGLDVTLGIDIAVRLFGLTMYRYRLDARERWDDGRLVAFDARTDDNGTRRSARATRDGDALVVEGSGFSGRVAGDAATQSYWVPDFLARTVWISLEDGRPRRVTATEVGAEEWATGAGAVEARRFRVSGDIDPIDLLYDRSGEWVGNEFRARGQTARFVLESRGTPLTPLWREA